VAQHAEHPDNRRIWNKVLPAGRKTVAPAKQEVVSHEQSQRDAEFQRELDDEFWLGQNNRPKTGALVEGELREVHGYVVRELPRRRLLPNGTVVMTLPRSTGKISECETTKPTTKKGT
jgi:hypothetical protein